MSEYPGTCKVFVLITSDGIYAVCSSKKVAEETAREWAIDCYFDEDDPELTLEIHYSDFWARDAKKYRNITRDFMLSVKLDDIDRISISSSRYGWHSIDIEQWPVTNFNKEYTN